MPYPNPLQQTPKDTKRERRSGNGYNLEFWATYFPTGGIEYHVDVINMDPGVEVRCEMQASLYIRAGGQFKNKAKMAEMYVSRERVIVKRVAKSGPRTAFANCGPEQISRVSHAELIVQGFEIV